MRRDLKKLITPEAIKLFRFLYEMEEEDRERWEEDGGRQREYSDACVKLHLLLGRLPAEQDVMYAGNPIAPDYCTPIDDYATAHALYIELEKRICE